MICRGPGRHGQYARTVLLQNEFDIDAPLETVWTILKDVPRVTPCIPQARLLRVVDATTFHAEVGVKVGPVSVAYALTVTIEGLDDRTHTADLRIAGRQQTGSGAVSATVRSRASEAGGLTRVTIDTDASVGGVIAGAGGRMIEGVAKRTAAEFAANLARLALS
jgi:carbon monoxide dehydrogenase subunit G